MTYALKKLNCDKCVNGQIPNKAGVYVVTCPDCNGTGQSTDYRISEEVLLQVTEAIRIAMPTCKYNVASELLEAALSVLLAPEEKCEHEWTQQHMGGFALLPRIFCKKCGEESKSLRPEEKKP